MNADRIQRTDGFWNEASRIHHCATIGMTGDEGRKPAEQTFSPTAWPGAFARDCSIRHLWLASAESLNRPVDRALQSSGLLGYTQSRVIGSLHEDTQAPGAWCHPGSQLPDDYGVGGFLLAGSEV